MAQSSLAQLRLEAARDLNDPRLAELVGELSLQDPDFRLALPAEPGAPSHDRLRILASHAAQANHEERRS